MADYQRALQIIQKDLLLPTSEINRQPVQNLDVLRRYLQEVICELLDNNFEKLLQAMYRIDIEESLFRKTLQAENPDDIPGKIADLILTRALEKIASREMYS